MKDHHGERWLPDCWRWTLRRAEERNSWYSECGPNTTFAKEHPAFKTALGETFPFPSCFHGSSPLTKVMGHVCFYCLFVFCFFLSRNLSCHIGMQMNPGPRTSLLLRLLLFPFFFKDGLDWRVSLHTFFVCYLEIGSPSKVLITLGQLCLFKF